MLNRLRAWQKIQQATSQTKALSNAIGAHDLSNISKHAPPATLAFAGRLVTMTGLGGAGPLLLHNCVVSNVPGANVALTMLGAKLCYWSAVAPIADGAGAFFAVSSMSGRMFISFTSCPKMVPDPTFFGDCIRASIAEMEAAATKPAAKTKSIAVARLPKRPPVSRARSRAPAKRTKQA